MTYEAMRTEIGILFKVFAPRSQERIEGVKNWHRMVKLSSITEEQKQDLRDRLGSMR